MILSCHDSAFEQYLFEQVLSALEKDKKRRAEKTTLRCAILPCSSCGLELKGTSPAPKGVVVTKVITWIDLSSCSDPKSFGSDPR
jgi:hypothetical protein